MFNGKIHYKWPFSIAMLNSSTRGNVLGPHNLAIPWDTLSRSSIPSLPNLYPNWLPKMKRSNVKSGFHLVGTLWLCQNSYWKWPFIYSGFSHWTWWFSIVFCMFKIRGKGLSAGHSLITAAPSHFFCRCKWTGRNPSLFEKRQFWSAW